MCKVNRRFFCRLMARNDKKRLKGLHPFGNINVRADVSYFDDGIREHKLDIIYPAKDSNGITLLYIHGGSYIYGYKEASEIFTSYFASKGFTVIAMNYRLADYKHGINLVNQLHDVFICLDFLRKNRIYYKLNIDKFAIMGDSAGGHLSLLTAICYHDEEAREFFGIKKLPDLDIKCYALNSPMYDMRPLLSNGERYLNKKVLKDIFTENYKNEEYLFKLSPRYYFNKGLKIEPLLVTTSLQDAFKSQSELMRKDQEKLLFDMEYDLCMSPDKKIDHVYNHFVFDKEGKECNDKMIDFIIKHTGIEKKGFTK